MKELMIRSNISTMQWYHVRDERRYLMCKGQNRSYPVQDSEIKDKFERGKNYTGVSSTQDYRNRHRALNNVLIAKKKASEGEKMADETT